MPQNAASGQGLHCLAMSHKKDVRLMWVNERLYLNTFFYQQLKITVIIFHNSLCRLLFMTSIIASSQRHCSDKVPMTKLSCDNRNLIAHNWPANSKYYNG